MLIQTMRMPCKEFGRGMQRGAIHRVSHLSLHLEIGFDFGNSPNSKPFLIQGAQASLSVGLFRHHVDGDIDVNQDLHPASLREICSPIMVLSSSTGCSGWIPTRAKR
jgi:hypothetical protein